MSFRIFYEDYPLNYLGLYLNDLTQYLLACLPAALGVMLAEAIMENVLFMNPGSTPINTDAPFNQFPAQLPANQPVANPIANPIANQPVVNQPVADQPIPNTIQLPPIRTITIELPPIRTIPAQVPHIPLTTIPNYLPITAQPIPNTDIRWENSGIADYDSNGNRRNRPRNRFSFRSFGRNS